ncbi:MAG TPA: VWA domain-containing protein [Acetobacteraceae bacterium]|jgi:uncharacterized protein YegL|nr:VWA domain-containing protein [Acetobacteraceae bacterium]
MAVLPLVILADASGSMAQEGKIEALNEALRELVRGCACRPGPHQVYLALIAFGGEGPRVVVALTPAARAHWADLQAGGSTSLGAALRVAANLLTNAAAQPDLLQPVLVLLSDGAATDDWTTGLATLAASYPASHAQRLAVAIGPDADLDQLALFVSGGGAERVIANGLEQDVIGFCEDLPLRPGEPANPDMLGPVDPAVLA